MKLQSFLGFDIFTKVPLLFAQKQNYDLFVEKPQISASPALTEVITSKTEGWQIIKTVSVFKSSSVPIIMENQLLHLCNISHSLSINHAFLADLSCIFCSDPSSSHRSFSLRLRFRTVLPDFYLDDNMVPSQQIPTIQFSPF